MAWADRDDRRNQPGRDGLGAGLGGSGTCSKRNDRELEDCLMLPSPGAPALQLPSHCCQRTVAQCLTCGGGICTRCLNGCFYWHPTNPNVGTPCSCVSPSAGVGNLDNKGDEPDGELEEPRADGDAVPPAQQLTSHCCQRTVRDCPTCGGGLCSQCLNGCFDWHPIIPNWGTPCSCVSPSAGARVDAGNQDNDGSGTGNALELERRGQPGRYDEHQRRVTAGGGGVGGGASVLDGPASGLGPAPFSSADFPGSYVGYATWWRRRRGISLRGIVLAKRGDQRRVTAGGGGGGGGASVLAQPASGSCSAPFSSAASAGSNGGGSGGSADVHDCGRGGGGVHVHSLRMLVAVFHSILVECYHRTGTFPNIDKVLSNSRRSMFNGLSPEQLRQSPIDPCLFDALDADAETGRNAPQQLLWQLAETFTVT